MTNKQEIEPSQELKPCPFCGSKAEMDSRQGFINFKRERRLRVSVYCLQCDAHMTFCHDDYQQYSVVELMEMARKNWNRRAGITPLQDRIKELEGALEQVICMPLHSEPYATVMNIQEMAHKALNPTAKTI